MLADVVVLAAVAVLASVAVWNAVSADVVVLAAAGAATASAAVMLLSLTCGAVAACFAVEPFVDLLWSWFLPLDKCLLKLLL